MNKFIKNRFQSSLAYCLMFLCLQPAALWAQSVSLEEAIELALKNRAELKNAQIDITLATRENEKLSAQWLPQVKGSADVRWNTQLQTTILPFDITGQNPAGSTELKFGLPFSNTLSIEAEQKILDPKSKFSRKLNENRVRIEQNVYQQKQISIRQLVTEAYYQVLLHQERSRLAEETVNREEKNLAITQTQAAAGTLLPNDLDRVQLDVRTANLRLRKARQDLNLALSALSFRMGLPDGETVSPAQTLRQVLTSLSINTEINELPRTELAAEELTLITQQLSQQREKAVQLPTLSAYGTYAALQLSEQFNPFASGTWYPFNYIGLRLNVPIFDGRQAKLAANDYVLRQQQSQQTFNQLQKELIYERQNALVTLQQAQLDVEDSRDNLELAQKILATDLFRFEKETLSLSELTATQSSVQDAEDAYLTNAYNYLLALVRYRKATGTL
ncbi:TolC family protein [Arundinibacter roseus]|nr:TolC family protein [Arundinibacter roseus]